MCKKSIAILLTAMLALGACAGCSSGSSTTSLSSVGESSVASEVSVESSKAESSEESSKVEKKITSIKLNDSSDIKMYDTDYAYKYVLVQGSGYDDYENEIEFISTNPKVATIELGTNLGSNKLEVWCKISPVSMGTTTIYAQTKDGKLKTDKINITVTSKKEESRLAEESRKAEESRQAEESRKAEESRIAEEKKNTLYNANGLKIVYKDISSDWYGKHINLYIENNSSENFTIQVRDFSINGYMIDPIFSSDVVSGKKINDDIHVFDSDLDDNNIDEIKTIEFKFHYFNSDSWSDDIDSDIIKINVK